MDSPGSSRSSSINNSCEDLQNMMDQKKRKRMISNRESARRSRMRKQKQMDDLMTQVSQLGTENNNLMINLNVMTQLCHKVEDDNSVLTAQMGELGQRLEALNEIIFNCMNWIEDTVVLAGFDENEDNYNYGYNEQMMNDDEEYDFLMDPWSLVHVDQPIMASSDVLMY